MSQWVSIECGFPKNMGMYLVYHPILGIMVEKWYGADNPDRPRENHGWKLPYGEGITHWRPLPEKPGIEL